MCVSFEGGKGLWNMNYLHLLILNMLLTHEWQQSWEQLQPFSADVTVTVYVEVFTKEKRNMTNIEVHVYQFCQIYLTFS